MNKVALFAVCRDEDIILNKWIEHHLSIGFQTIYILDDLSKNKVKYNSENVKIFRNDHDFFNHDEFKNSIYYNEELYHKHKTMQVYFYNIMYKIAKNLHQWVLIVDIDEFLSFNNTTLNDFLIEYGNYDSIYVPLLFHGSSYHLNFPKNCDLFDAFQLNQGEYFNLGKTFFKTSCVESIDEIHRITNIKNNLNLVQPKRKFMTLPVHIHHYVILDVYSFFIRRMLRKMSTEATKCRDYNYIKHNIQLFNNKNKNYEDVDPLFLYYGDKLFNDIDQLSEKEIFDGFNNGLFSFDKITKAYPNFDQNDYINLNKDLLHFTPAEGIHHFMLNGRFEGRLTKK